MAKRKKSESSTPMELSPIIDASFLMENKKRIISVSPSLDIGLSGKIGQGVPEGSWIILSGVEKIGKTATALQIAANFQKQLNKRIYYGNVEHRIKPRDLSTHNLDIKKVKVIQSQKGQILSAEKHLEIYRDILKNESDVVLIIDSGSALCSQDEMDGEITANRRILGPKLLATFCRQMEAIIPLQDNVLIIILHVIANTGPGMSTKIVDGGRKIKYQADVNLEATHFKIESSGDNAGYGQEINWIVRTSALSSPGAKVRSFFRYGYGLDEEKELIDIGQSCGLITTGKSGWSKLNWWNEDAKSIQGSEKMREYLLNNPDEKQILINKINDLL